VEAQRDPTFAGQVARRNAMLEEELATTLSAAMAAGELKSTDSRQLAHLLFTSLVGAGYLWSVQPQGPVSERYAAILNSVLAPYEVTGKKRKSSD
jgi:hypothetical protein